MNNKELDKESPHIPVGYMQPGGADNDGNWEEAKYAKDGDNIELMCDLRYCEPIYILGRKDK